jgi:AcrR family transcriptional regulator
MQTAEAMQERRQRILARARTLLADSDPDAFSVRNLAAVAQVSATTIYNLIGDKNTVLLEICRGMLEDIEHELEAIDDDLTVEKLEAGVLITTDLADPAKREQRRAANIAFDYLWRQTAHGREAATSTRPAVDRHLRVIRRGQEIGTLRGDVPAELMNTQIMTSQMMALLDWTYRRIPLEDYRKRSLAAIYLTLLADASQETALVLREKIRQLGPARARPISDGLHLGQ